MLYSADLKPNTSIWGASVVSSFPCGPEYQYLRVDTARPFPLTSDPSSDVDTAWNHLSSSLDGSSNLRRNPYYDLDLVSEFFLKQNLYSTPVHRVKNTYYQAHVGIRTSARPSDSASSCVAYLRIFRFVCFHAREVPEDLHTPLHSNHFSFI